MSKEKNLKRTLERQLALIADFFGGDLSQGEILTKHRVSEQSYRAWQHDPSFVEEVDNRIASAYRESAALIARFATPAAVRLIELTKSLKDEIARRACLDIISLHPPNPPPVRRGAEEPTAKMSEATASKILAALADAADEPGGSDITPG